MVRQFYPGEGNTISYVHLYVCLRDYQTKEKKDFWLRQEAQEVTLSVCVSVCPCVIFVNSTLCRKILRLVMR